MFSSILTMSLAKKVPGVIALAAFLSASAIGLPILDGAVKSCWPMACLYRSLRFGEEYLPVSALLVDKT